MTTREWTDSASSPRRIGSGFGSLEGVSTRPMIKLAASAWRKESKGIENSVLGVLLNDAVARGDARDSSELLRRGADPDHCMDAMKTTPLMSAVSSLRQDIVRLLLDAQADPTKKDADGFDAMDRVRLAEDGLSVRSEEIGGRMKRISELLQNDGAAMARWEKEGNLSELASCQEELDGIDAQKEECRAIKKKIEKRLDAILLEAARSDDMARAIQAIEAGADIICFDNEGRSPYMIARGRGFADLENYLKNELDDNLAILIEEGCRDEIISALRAGAEPKSR